MATQQKGFIYSTGEDQATDSYIESIAGKRVDRMQSASSEMDVNGGSTWYTSADQRPQYKNSCARVGVLIFNGILLLAGIGLCILARVEKDKKVLPLCPHCSELMTVMYIFGGALIVFALIGILSAVSRFKPLAFIYALLVLLLAIACIAAGFAVVVFETGMKETEVEKLWKDAVDDQESFICTLQDRLQCSGFNKCCQVVPGTANVSSFNCNATVGEYVSQCDVRCSTSNDQYTEPCNNKVEDEVKAHFKPLIGVTFALGFILILVAVAAVRMTLRSSA